MKILCVCFSNTARSPMMAALLGALLPEAVVESAGMNLSAVHYEVEPYAVTVMREFGADLSGHQCRYIDDVDLTSYDYVVAIGPHTADHFPRMGIAPDRTIALIDVENPRHRTLEVYVACAEQLARYAEDLAHRLA